MIEAAALALAISCGAQLPTDALTSADDPYAVQREFTSPISGESFYANVLRGTVPVGDWDYDRCPHPPLNTLAYALVIDPVTGYVAAPEEFEQATRWDAEDLAQILGAPRFKRLAPEGLPWAGSYPWEKLENAALLSQAEDQPAHFTGNWWLLAAWSVRLDVISGHNQFDSKVTALFESMPRREPDPGELLAPYELQLARHWEDLRSTGQLADIAEEEYSLAMAWLYRSRGELVAAEHWLRSAGLSNPELRDGDELYEYLQSSIELERHYLGMARRWLLKGWDGAEFSPLQEGGTAFMLGELNRRLGDLPSALYWYDVARAKNMGMLSNELLDRLTAAVKDGRGY